MIKGLTKAGLPRMDDKTLIRKAGAYGFEAVDLDFHALIQAEGREGAAALLQENGVTAGSFDLSVEWRKGDAEFREGLTRLAGAAEAAQRLGSRACCTYILPSTDASPARFMAQTVRRLRSCAEVLGAYDIRLGLEFVGPHHLRTAWASPFIWTAEETLELAAAIGLPNVGLLVDVYHCHTTGLTAQDLLQLRSEQIVHVHINDARDLPVDQLLDNDRLYPGEGIIDIAGMLDSLQRIGYCGVVSQEVLTSQEPSAPADELLERSRAGFGKVSAEL